MPKVKIFERKISNETNSDFETRINDFIKNKEIINIKYSTELVTQGDHFRGYTSEIVHCVLIMYKED